MYITKANLKQICKQGVGADLDKIESIKDFRDLLDEFCNREEKNQIYTAALIFYNKILEQNFRKIPSRPDTKTYVYEGGKPCYHIDKKCPFLSSDFPRITIPDTVRKKGDSEVARYRKWWKDGGGKDYYQNKSSFLLTIKAEFQLSEGDLSIYESNFENSGKANFSDRLEIMTLEQLKSEIDVLQEQLNDFKQNDLVWKIKYMESYKIKKIYKNYVNASDFISFADKKSKLMECIFNFLKKESCFDGQIEESILQSLGFLKCRHCFAIAKRYH